MSKKVLGSFGSVTAIAQDTGTDDVFVTFNELGLIRAGDRFWGDGFFEKCGIAAVGVVTDRPNWYPEADMLDALEAIRRTVAGRRVITYGHSQGGYGALRFSRPLGAVASIAFCPQVSIDPADIAPHDRRFESYFQPGSGGGRRLSAADLCAANYVFYDSLETSDSLHASMIAALGNVVRVTAPFTGHDTIRIITQSSAARLMIESFRGGALPDQAMLRAMLRRARRDSPVYWRHRAIALLHNLPRFAKSFMRTVQHMPPANRKVFVALYLAGMGLAPEAADLAASCGDAELRSAGLLELWRVCRSTNLIGGELFVANLLRRAHPDEAFPRLHAVNTFLKAGLKVEASRELDAIIARFGTTQHTNLIRTWARMLGRTDIEFPKPAGGVDQRR